MLGWLCLPEERGKNERYSDGIQILLQTFFT